MESNSHALPFSKETQPVPRQSLLRRSDFYARRAPEVQEPLRPETAVLHDETAQRIAAEAAYVLFYGERIAEALGQQRLEFAIVGDREGLTALAPDPRGGPWRGIQSDGPLSINGLKNALSNLSRTVAS